MDFLNMNLPSEENENNKFPKLDIWFDFMNTQLNKIEKNVEKCKINSLLIDNDIDIIE
tara:strand:- start:181 stop:354 length:174 start_codon:yes stop_codon:yes gene_type:complete